MAGEGVGERVAGDIDGEAIARRGDAGLFDVRRQRVAGGAGEGDPDEIEAFANGFRDDVAGDVDLVLVVAAAADERVAAGAADQRVVAGEAAEDVGGGVAGEAVVEFVAGDVDGDSRAGGDGGVFELGGEGIAAGSGEGDVDLVGAFGVLLDDDVGGDVDVVGVVAGSADQDVVADCRRSGCRCRRGRRGCRCRPGH
jgi:hypothetical protein